jgi:hypothetical protein
VDRGIEGRRWGFGIGGRVVAEEEVQYADLQG